MPEPSASATLDTPPPTPLRLSRVPLRALAALPGAVLALPGRAAATVAEGFRDLDADEDGQTLPFLAMTCFICAVCVFMVIHLGQLLSAKMQVQVGADAAALTNAVWIARGMNVQSHLNIAMMLWLTNLIIYRTWWVTILLVNPPFGLGWWAMCEALWFFVGWEMGNWRPLWDLNEDTFFTDLIADGFDGMGSEWIAGSGDFYDFFAQASDIEETVSSAAPLVGGVSSVAAAASNGVWGASASFGDAPNPYEEGHWNNLCHNVPGFLSGNGAGIKEGDGPQGGWTLDKHDPVIGLLRGMTLDRAVNRAASGPGMGGLIRAFTTISSTGGPLFSSFLTAPMLYFLNPAGGQGMYHLAHIQYMMQLPTWYAFFCPDPGMNPLSSVPGISLTDDDTWTDPESHDTGTLRRGGLTEIFGALGSVFEERNDWIHGGHMDARPRILRSDWYDVRFYTSVAATHIGGTSAGAVLPSSEYFDAGPLAEVTGALGLAEAEVYNPNIAPGNPMERVIGMYSPNWRARLRPYELAHVGDNMPIDMSSVLDPIGTVGEEIIMH